MCIFLALLKKKYTEPHVLFLNFGDGSLVCCFICRYFLTFYALSFHFAYGFLRYAKGFKYLFLFLFFTLGGGPKKVLLPFMSKSILLMFYSRSFTGKMSLLLEVLC